MVWILESLSQSFSVYILDFQLNWSKHLSGITNKIANHVSVMYRVRPFTVQIVHSFCRQACLPYLNYCCEAWGNTYKSSIQPLYILFRTRQLGFVENEDYRSHTATNGKHLAFMT